MRVLGHSARALMPIAGLWLLLGGLITACGSANTTGSMQTGSDGKVGTVAILLTDGPTTEFSVVNVTVNEVSLLSEEQPPVILFTGGRQINLLALQEDEDLFMIHEGVPTGLYSKIRLRVSSPQFVTLDGKIIGPDQIDLVADGKVDLVPQHPFQVLTGETLAIQLDLDAENSILIDASSSGKYQFRPVVFVTIPDELHARLVHVSGLIVSIDQVSNSFLLRHPHRIRHVDLGDVADARTAESGKPNLDGVEEEDDPDDPRHLVRVVVSDDTHCFNIDGLPGNCNSLEVGQHVLVWGLLSLEGGLHIQARLIEIGHFIRLHGLITARIDSEKHFGLRPDPGQGIIGDLVVQVHTETLIFEAGTHRPLGPEVLVAGKRVVIEGVLDVGVEPDLLHAAVIVVRPPEAEIIHLQGIISDVNPEARTFNLAEGPPCAFAEPPCLVPLRIILVHVMPDAVIIRIRRDDEGHLIIELIRFADLMDRNKVTLFGQFDDSATFHARVIVVEGTSAVLPP